MRGKLHTRHARLCIEVLLLKGVSDRFAELISAHVLPLCRMDGSTAVAMRARLMDDFNNNPDVFVFLLTTKVRRSNRSLHLLRRHLSSRECKHAKA